MSATPEQIADLCERLRTELTGYEGLLIEAADALSAQAERVRVLESALTETIIDLNVYTDIGIIRARAIERRAALRGEA